MLTDPRSRELARRLVGAARRDDGDAVVRLLKEAQAEGLDGRAQLEALAVLAVDRMRREGWGEPDTDLGRHAERVLAEVDADAEADRER